MIYFKLSRAVHMKNVNTDLRNKYLSKQCDLYNQSFPISLVNDVRARRSATSNMNSVA